MKTQRDKKKIINYSPESLHSFKVTIYEWIDNLCFTLSPDECLDDADIYVKIVKKIFLQNGRAGDGKIELIWIPPFVFDKTEPNGNTTGIIVWHVKQNEDGISWILYPNEAEKVFI